MTTLKFIVAAVVLATPMIFSSAPAMALTSHQYQEQGRGRYVSSKARTRHHRAHRFHR